MVKVTCSEAEPLTFECEAEHLTFEGIEGIAFVLTSRMECDLLIFAECLIVYVHPVYNY